MNLTSDVVTCMFEICTSIYCMKSGIFSPYLLYADILSINIILSIDRRSVEVSVCLSDCLFVCSVRLHDDVIKWKHFPRNWPFVREIHRSPVNFPYKGQWRGALMFSLIYAWMNDWVNNREAGDLRRQHGHYDVIVMACLPGCSAVWLSLCLFLSLSVCPSPYI